MNRIQYKLYWEDIGERLVYAELDDLCWKLAEKFFCYQKENSLYIYHHGKLAALYSEQDTASEKEAGYLFYKNYKNIRHVIKLKREASQAAKTYLRRAKSYNPKKMSDEQLRDLLLHSLTTWQNILNVHFLSQPQFFLAFEENNISELQQSRLDEVSHARFYTRVAFSSVLEICRLLFQAYARRFGISQEEAENLRFKEIRNQTINIKKLKERTNGFVLISKKHNFRVYTGSMVKSYREKYEDYDEATILTGFVGNRGQVKGRTFVVKNEGLDFKNLPSGMKKGMILVVQNAWPELAKYYKLASAIVTNEGGITSHGVVVARELRIPCIVRTNIATKILKTGDLVEVDANQGIVKILSKHR